MKVTMHFQDPSKFPNSKRYIDCISEYSVGAVNMQGVFAFATRNGINLLFGIENFQKMLNEGRAEIVVGIDSVTTNLALERLLELEEKHKNLSAYAFVNDRPSSLFHPKACQFTYADGSRIVIVGSNNLTPGGLSNNYEYFAVYEFEPNETTETATIDRFFSDNRSRFSQIDDAIIKRAMLNAASAKRNLESVLVATQSSQEVENDAQTTSAAQSGQAADLTDMETILYADSRVLIAEIPRAGDRWAQVHFNRDVMESFFQATAEETVYFQPWGDGAFLPVETRPCIYSVSNKNYKIEATVLKGIDYPEGDLAPIIIFLETAYREFRYLVIMPDHPLYSDISALNRSHVKIGRGNYRSIALYSEIARIWPSCPLGR